METPEQPFEPPRVNYLNKEYGLKSWLLTKDHKRIALLYLGSVTLFFLLGGIYAMLIRLELLTPQSDIFQANTYNKVFTQHGILMVFFFLIPAIPAVLGNFLVPIMIGAKDLAFPRINLLSWYIYVVGGIFTLWALISGGVDTGWTFYAPYSTTFSNSFVILAGVGIFITGFSSILTGLNFIVTIHTMRAPGMTWFRLPLFIWSHYATSLIMVLGTPVIAITVLLLAFERLTHVGIFDPAYGGDPILFQHLFWFYSHPAVYIMILPSMGVVSELIANFSRKNIFGYTFVAFSSIAIAVFGFLVWGHHMFVSGQSVYAGLIFSFLSFAVAIPSAIKVFNWTATLFKGSISYDTPMLYGLGFIGLFLIGGMTGLFLAAARPRHTRARHLFRRGAFPLRHGGRDRDGLPRRPALLVAQNHRADVPGGVGALRGAGRLRRVQPDVLPAVFGGLHGDAPALRGLRARVPGAERDEHGRGLHPRARDADADDLLHLVHAVRARGVREPVAAAGAGVAHAEPAADGKLRGYAGRHLGGLRVRAARGGPGRRQARPPGRAGLPAGAGLKG